MFIVAIIWLLFFCAGIYIRYRIKKRKIENEYAYAYQFRQAKKVGDDKYDVTGLHDFLGL